MADAQPLSFALGFSRHGARVFPCHYILPDGQCSCGSEKCRNDSKGRGKHPLHRGWQAEATADKQALMRAWNDNPLANVGIACGKGSNLTVVDVDGTVGLAQLREFETKYGALSDTPRVITGSGGYHLLFQYEEGLTNAVRWAPGLDIRTEGGLIIGAGSRNAFGPYVFETGYSLKDLPRAKMPDWLIECIKQGQGGAHANGHSNGNRFKMPEEPIHEGEGRNNWLFRGGRSMKANGWTASAIEAALDTINREQCKPPLGPDEFTALLKSVLTQRDSAEFKSAGANSNSHKSSDDGWPDPEEVGVELSPVPKCVPAMLPESVRSFLTDIAERQQSPLEFSTVALIVAASAVVGRKVGIRPKREDDWHVVPNLWGAVVGPPGVLMKTPTLNDALRPLEALIKNAAADYERAIVGFEFDAVWSDGLKKKVADSVQKEVKAGADRDMVRLKYADEYAKALVKKPSERRYMTSDSTVEKLGELLNENPNGILLKRDELSGWLRSLERQGREGERAFFLEAWNGFGRFDYDRIARGTLHIEATCTSVLGGIQPGPLSAYLQETFARGGDDGLIQRFQLAVYPDLAPGWRNVDRRPDAQAQERVAAIFVELDQLEPAKFGAIADNGNPPFVRFTDEAQGFFNSWRGELELRLRSGEEHPVLAGHLAKYRSLMPSLALIFELMDFGSQPLRTPPAADGKVVTLGSAELAAAWCDFLEAHAKRVYQGITAQVLTAAAFLADKIKRGKLPNPLKPHAVYHAGWNSLSSPEETYRALEVLEEAGWVRRREIPTTAIGGRPSTVFDINPKVLPPK